MNVAAPAGPKTTDSGTAITESGAGSFKVASTRFKPGDPVPKSGIYKVTHATEHEPVHTVTLLGGNIFPRCHGCVHPHFELVQAAISAELHEQFKLTSENVPSSLRHPKRMIIFAVLLLFLGAGMLLIWFADHLAGIPWIASAAKFLHQPNDASLGGEAPEHKLLFHLFEEMGIAFVIAAMLGATFEFFMRRREEKELDEHIRQLEEAALLSMLGYFMPRSLSDQVRRVFHEQIMRSNLELTYTFKKPTPDLQQLSRGAGIDGNDLVLVTVKVEYDLVNLATIKKDHLIHHGFESILPFGGEHDKFLGLTISLGNKPWLSWPDGMRKRRVCYGTGPHPCIRVLKLKSIVCLAPGKQLDSEPGMENTYHVAVEYQIARRRRDLDSWTTWLPADRLDVNVVFKDVPELDFHLDRTHPEDFREVDQAKIKQQSATERRWMLPSYPINRDGKQRVVSAAVLPYQGFTLYWFPKGSFPVIDKPKAVALSEAPVPEESLAQARTL